MAVLIDTSVIIPATAVSRGAKLLTSNERDFRRIPLVELMVW